MRKTSILVLVFTCLFYLEQVAGQFELDYFVFTVRLSCRVKEKPNFRFKIEYWEHDLTTEGDRLTRFNNTGKAVKGEVLVNNFGKLYGDVFHPFDRHHGTYEPYLIIHHECTEVPGKMRTMVHFTEPCLIKARNCNRKIKLDVTEQGEENDVVDEVFQPDDFSF